jgi:hypothetical protein
MSTQVTAVLSDSAMPRMRNSRNPAINPPKITEEMEFLVGQLIRSPLETDELIGEIEGCWICGQEDEVLVDQQCETCTQIDVQDGREDG